MDDITLAIPFDKIDSILKLSTIITINSNLKWENNQSLSFLNLLQTIFNTIYIGHVYTVRPKLDLKCRPFPTYIRSPPKAFTPQKSNATLGVLLGRIWASLLVAWVETSVYILRWLSPRPIIDQANKNKDLT